MSLSNKTTLILDFQPKGFDTGGRQVDAMTGKMKNAIGSFDTYGKSVDQAGTKTQSFSQKIQQFGSKFGQTIANVGTLGTTVLNLSRQYQDLGDTQIAVEKAQRRVSTADVAVTKAKDRLTAATLKYGAGSKEAKLATQELTNAQSQLSINTQLLTERQEDHQRAQENFWLGLGPTIASAGGTAMAAVKELTGMKGFGGLTKSVEAATASIGIGGVGGGKGGGKGAGLLGALGGIGGSTLLSGPLLPIVAVLAELYTASQVLPKVAEGFKNLGDPANVQRFGEILESIKSGTAGGGIVDLADQLLRVTPAIKEFDNSTGKSTAGYKKWILELRTAQQPLTDVVSEMQKWGFTSKEISATIAEVDAEMRKQSAPVKQYADNWRFLGANLQPLPPLLDQMTGVLQTANASLAASGSGVSNLAAGMQLGTATAAEWVAQSERQIATDQAFQVSLFQTAQAMGIKTANEDDSVAILQLLIERTQAMEQGNYDLAASLDALIRKQGQANQVAAAGMQRGPAPPVYRTNLVPTSKSLKGPRNPKFRLRSDYQAALVGSPFGQRQMLSGTRPMKKPKIKIKEAQFGMNETVRDPTWILAGETGDEDVRITKRGKGGVGVGNSPINVNVNVYLDGEKLGSNSTLVRKLRHTLNEGQGTMR